MKGLFIIVLFFSQTVASAETVSKWIDVNGRLHYGDNWQVKKPASESTLVINDTFDEASYKAASRRYSEYEKELKLKEKQRKDKAKKEKRSGKKAPLTASEKYDLYLEKEEVKKQNELKRKRERRAEARRKWKMDCNDSRNANRIACR
jgi:hypothetical protein